MPQAGLDSCPKCPQTLQGRDHKFISSRLKRQYFRVEIVCLCSNKDRQESGGGGLLKHAAELHSAQLRYISIHQDQVDVVYRNCTNRVGGTTRLDHFIPGLFYGLAQSGAVDVFGIHYENLISSSPLLSPRPLLKKIPIGGREDQAFVSFRLLHVLRSSPFAFLVVVLSNRWNSIGESTGTSTGRLVLKTGFI